MEQDSPGEAAEWDIPAAFAALVERRGLEFLADFYRAELARKPDNLEVLVDLGHALTRLGRYREGLEVDRELARREPEDPNVLYNLACSLALTGDPDEAFRTLDRAILHGYDDADHLAQDEDFAGLRDDPRFAPLLESLRRAGA